MSETGNGGNGGDGGARPGGPSAPSERPHRRRYGPADDVIGAIRLALEGSENPDTQLRVITALCEKASPTPATAQGPVRLFLDTVRELGGSFTVPAGER